MPTEYVYFGFEDTPYQSIVRRGSIIRKKSKELRKSRKRGFKTSKTAADISDYLEEKYRITDIFWEKYGDNIMDLVNEIAVDRLERVLAGTLKIKDTSIARMAKPAFPKIESMFRRFLDKREMDGVVPGVPTDAAAFGISHWYRKGSVRPSFIDSGIYRASFRAWIE